MLIGDAYVFFQKPTDEQVSIEPAVHFLFWFSLPDFSQSFPLVLFLELLCFVFRGLLLAKDCPSAVKRKSLAGVMPQRLTGNIELNEKKF